MAEYNSRIRLKELGYTTNISELDSFKAECFCIISVEIGKIEKEKMDKQRVKRR